MDMNVSYMISAQISMIAQHDSSRLGFPTLTTSLYKARGVTSYSLSFESLSPTINLAYVKKNCWNLDDLSVTFRGPRKTKGKRSEALPSSTLPTPAPSTFTAAPSTLASSLLAPALAPSTSTTALSAPATSTPLSAPASTPVSTGSSSFSSDTLYAMLQSLHKGQIIIMQRLQSSGLHLMISMEEFLSQVAWPGV
ncbi:uncharacterized protein LOC114404442 [Glycine soja]|uniref:uncharacterized protein n=1 Tax=Glycine max TaxID=3847 RepID=UPI0007190B06|nr:uncharacterized protein LOC106799507 [Glycine max]XP_028223186.1 uncharacterized protein LOC114404442 [Glycine soja]|eukprot:XP_014633780.1 uncharacterized protein LOC106799507 [Glycine max]